MVLKALLKMFAIFIGPTIDQPFRKSVFGRDINDLVIEIKFLIPFYAFLDHLSCS